MTIEIQEKNALVTVTFRVYTTDTSYGDQLECDENGVLFSQNTDFSGFSREADAREVLREINKKYPAYDPEDENQEYQKYKNENWISKQTYIVLLDDDGEEEDSISIIEILETDK